MAEFDYQIYARTASEVCREHCNRYSNGQCEYGIQPKMIRRGARGKKGTYACNMRTLD